MRRFTLVSFLTLAAATIAASSVHAQNTSTATVTGATSTRGRGIGLGAVQMLDLGRTNLLLSYGEAGGRFHIDGLFGLSRNFSNSGSGNDYTTFDLGGRFWYHLHAAAFADFSLGGGMLMDSYRTNPNSRRYDFLMDLGAQIRAFVVPNVALIGTLGIGLKFRDGSNDEIQIGGQSMASVGIAYFFE
jgi:hypothetical protein